MKIFKVDPKYQIEAEAKQHSAEEKRLTTKSKTKIRKKHINTIKKVFPKAKKILCIGCRHDAEVKDFIRNGYKAFGVDVANESKYIKRLDAHKLMSEFEEKSFDVVYASHSLEHMYDVKTVLENIRSIANIGVFIVLPQSGMRKGIDPGEPSVNHPSIFDVMDAKVSSKDELTDHLLEDFKHLNKFDVAHYCIGIRDIEMAFRFK